MNYSILTKSNLFEGMTEKDIIKSLEAIPHKINHYDRNEVIFHLLEPADTLGIVVKGQAESQKPFPKPPAGSRRGRNGGGHFFMPIGRTAPCSRRARVGERRVLSCRVSP